jgi:thioredoxin reductase (NADPH)
MDSSYDIVVVGAGPAGLSAAITARARNKNVLVISNKPQNNPLAKSGLIDNYPGFPQVSGLQLLEQMVAHAHEMGARFLYERVISVLVVNEQFTVTTANTNIQAGAVILAPGAQSAKPFEGEEEYLGRGVSYCATCDGRLYRAQTVCVVGLHSEAVDEANFLAEIGAKVVFLAKKAPQGLAQGIVVEQGAVVAIQGDENSVTELVFRKGQTGETKSLHCNGVFILRSSIAPVALVNGLAINENFIAVDPTMSTNLAGVFAAGDCVGQPFQVAKAVGEGQCACFSAVHHLDQH